MTMTRIISSDSNYQQSFSIDEEDQYDDDDDSPAEFAHTITRYVPVARTGPINAFGPVELPRWTGRRAGLGLWAT